ADHHSDEDGVDANLVAVMKKKDAEDEFDHAEVKKIDICNCDESFETARDNKNCKCVHCGANCMKKIETKRDFRFIAFLRCEKGKQCGHYHSYCENNLQSSGMRCAQKRNEHTRQCNDQPIKILRLTAAHTLRFYKVI